MLATEMIDKIEIVSFWEEDYGEGHSVSRSFTLMAEATQGLSGEEVAGLIRQVRSVTPPRSDVKVDGNDVTAI